MWMFVGVLLTMAASWVYAQAIGINPVTPTVLSGGDIGFRVEGDRGGTPVGTLVVKINGQWVPADFTNGISKRITAR
jgi:hypothetical protein